MPYAEKMKSNANGLKETNLDILQSSNHVFQQLICFHICNEFLWAKDANVQEAISNGEFDVNRVLFSSLLAFLFGLLKQKVKISIDNLPDKHFELHYSQSIHSRDRAL